MARFFDALSGEMRTLAWAGRSRPAATPRQVEARVEGNCWECATEGDGAPDTGCIRVGRAQQIALKRRIPIIPRSRVGWVNARVGRPVEEVAIRVYFWQDEPPPADITGFLGVYGNGGYSVKLANDGGEDNWWRYAAPVNAAPVNAAPAPALILGQRYHIRVVKLEHYWMQNAHAITKGKLIGKEFLASYATNGFSIEGFIIHPDDVELTA